MILVTLITTVITFFIGYFFYEELHSHPAKLGNRQIHHSLVGISLIVFGLLINKKFGVISAVGLGIYLSHVIEEIYLNKVPPLKAILMFVTKI
jgi:hypothetical protein